MEGDGEKRSSAGMVRWYDSVGRGISQRVGTRRARDGGGEMDERTLRTSGQAEGTSSLMVHQREVERVHGWMVRIGKGVVWCDLMVRVPWDG